ncbi:related to RTA1 domain protein, putative-Aspergillus clavatus [Serendipita indica DSM 11827]|uniref:Related to RTA1 domain protein, putative-Aspergillus clavatus n=1 Tax=Serendipita indica (strain DSM 11827) TaxID=1109443 RepID=G4TVW9_SERID|nr:related to RTA1 domain protein, putative-Aspergillus clavatus [Serendipita indica DSM 11827]
MTACDSDSPFWCYKVNRPAAYWFLAAYFLNALGHLYQARRYRAKYAIPLVVGSTFTTIGFAFKIWSSYYPKNLGAWITAVILLFTAPPIYSAADYFIFAKTLHYVPSQAPMHPGRVVTTFVAFDGFCEMLMGTGVGQVVNYDNPTKVRIGSGLIKAGLLLQIVLFLLFVMVAARFHSNVRKAKLVGRWTTVLYVLYTSAFVISVRCLYRVVEYWMGTTGPLYRLEVYFQIFEATLMLINVLVLNIWHPGRYLPKSNKIFLNENGQEESTDRGGWDDNRPFIQTLLDPFNIQGLIRARREKKQEADSHPLEEKQTSV